MSIPATDINTTQRQLEILRILVQGEIDIQAGVGYDVDVVMAEADVLTQSAEPAQDEREFMRAVEAGLEDIEAGRVVPRDEVVPLLGLERHTSEEGTRDGVAESEDGALRTQEGQGLLGQEG